MRTYLQTHDDSRLGTYLAFRLAENKIEDPSFEWEETNREFSYRGEMYDVVSVKTANDSIRICAWKDDRENELGKQMAAIRHSQNDTGSHPAISLIKFFSAFTFSDTGIVFSSYTGTVCYAASPFPAMLSGNTEILSPPPRG